MKNKRTRRTIWTSLFILLLLVLFSSNAIATDLKTELSIIQKASETKYLENEQGYISKTIVNSNADTGEVTIELKLSNTNTKQNVTINQSNGKGTEIFLIIDESGSMYDKVSDGKTRREVVRESSKKLAKSILEKYKDVEIGIIKFASSVEMTSVLTTDINQINTAIDEGLAGATDLYDALVLAKDNYSNKNINKLAIILTDGSPNLASISKDEEGNYISAKEITKQELINLQKTGVNIVTMMTEVENESTAAEVFGTPEKPTVGKYYYIADTNIAEVIEKNIYSDIEEQIQKANNAIEEITIIDYFPEDIVENFEFSYIGNPSVGTVSNTIDSENNTIEWDVGTLKGNEEATLQYKLKIKDMQNPNLLNKTIATNEKVELTYKDIEAKEHTVILTSSPKIQLSEIKENKNENNEDSKDNKDNTIATGIIPQTGMNNIIIYSMVGIVIITVITYLKIKSYKDIK